MKKKQKVKAAVVTKGTSAKTDLSYSLKSAKKGKKSFKSKFSVAKNGQITVQKGLGKGTYKLTINAKAAQTNQYKSDAKAFTLSIAVK